MKWSESVRGEISVFWVLVGFMGVYSLGLVDGGDSFKRIVVFNRYLRMFFVILIVFYSFVNFGSYRYVF